MPQSYTSCHYHVTFATKNRKPYIAPDLQKRLYPYIGGIVRESDGELLTVGGTADHTHLLFRLHPSRALATVVRDIKACSSKWVHETFAERAEFRWQPGYGGFTVSYSGLDTVRAYIAHQEEHHRKLSFDEELQRLCARHNIPFDLGAGTPTESGSTSA